jgi:transposase
VRTSGSINALKVIELLDALRLKHPTVPITLVLDNARYQHCKLVMEHAGNQDIELLFLPAYSPNLNLIERLWKLTKKKCLNNRYYRSFDAFCAAIDACMESFEKDCRDELASLMTLNFQFFTSHKL